MGIAIAIVFMVVFAMLGLKKPGIALITSPIVCLLLGFGILAESAETILLAPAIFLVTLIAILVGKPKPEMAQWPRLAAGVVLISLCVLLFVVTVIVMLFGGAAGFAILILFVGGVGFFGAVISFAVGHRRATAAIVISTIGASVRQNLPLPMALESAANGRNDSRARILRGICKWLVQGYPLSESIKRGYPGCPGYALAMIASAERFNQVPAALKALEADVAARADEKRRLKPVHPWYPIAIVTFTAFILWGVMTFVLPTFRAVLEEMVGRDMLPAPTRVLMGIMRFIYDDIGIVSWAVLAVVIVVTGIVSIFVRLRPRRAENPYLLSRIGDFVKWHLPVLHWFERNYSMVHVVESLRLLLGAGRTVNDAITNTLVLDVNGCFKKRLKKWLARVEAGDNVAAAARECRLGSPLAWAFDDQVNKGNTLAILETLESFYRSNYSYRVNLARFIMWPCVTVALGTMAAFVILGIFLPGITVITALAGQVTP